MSSRPGRKPLHLPRVALLLVLALGVIAQSLIGVMGDLHESVLHAEAGETYTHQHASHAHHDLAQDAPQEQDHDSSGSDALHLLQHQSCGGHCAWMAGLQLGVANLDWHAVALPVDSARQIAPFDYSAPFRPPISA